MITFNLGRILSKVAGATASAQWKVVKDVPNVGIVLCDAGDASDGTSKYDITAGGPVSLIINGEIPGIAAGPIAVGHEVCAAAGGKLQDVDDAASGNIIIGKLTNGTFAGADGDEVVYHRYETGQYAKA